MATIFSRIGDRLALGLDAPGLGGGTKRRRELRSAVRTHDVSVPRTINGRQGAADYFIPPPSIASIAKSIAAFRRVAESVRRIDLSLSVE